MMKVKTENHMIISCPVLYKLANKLSESRGMDNLHQHNILVHQIQTYVTK